MAFLLFALLEFGAILPAWAGLNERSTYLNGSFVPVLPFASLQALA